MYSVALVTIGNPFHNNFDWIKACMKHRGKILRGVYTHYCPTWNSLPIDETMEEFSICRCYKHDSMCTVDDGYEGYGCVSTCHFYKNKVVHIPGE